MHYQRYLEALVNDAYHELLENYYDCYDESELEVLSPSSDPCPAQDGVKEEDNYEEVEDCFQEEIIIPYHDNPLILHRYLIGKHAQRYAKIRYRSADEPATYTSLLHLLYFLRSVNCVSWDPDHPRNITFKISSKWMKCEDQVSLLLSGEPNLLKEFMVFMEAIPEEEDIALRVASNIHHKRVECPTDTTGWYDFEMILGYGNDYEQ